MYVSLLRLNHIENENMSANQENIVKKKDGIFSFPPLRSKYHLEKQILS